MKLSEIYSFLDALSPFQTQANWDNSGLLLGDFENEIKTIYLSLDLDENLIENAEKNSLFITHHPLIFNGLKDLAGQNYPRKFIKKMLEKNLSLICMHTNYDLSHLNAYFIEEILRLKIARSEGFLAFVEAEFEFKKLCEFIKKRLEIPFLRTSFAGKKNIKTLAICTGSGGDLIDKINADCFLSGDFKYHQALEAASNGLSLIDIGHFESENCFATSLGRNLQNLPLKVIICVSKNPFQYF